LNANGIKLEIPTKQGKESKELIIAYYCLCRSENGELRLGIRRAIRPRNGLPESIVGNQNCYPNFLSSVANAISTKSMFHVFYSPRY
jgi:hypothetical protein